MSDDVPMSLRQAVIARAGQRCEYCLYPQLAAFLSFELEHIIARKHAGATALHNLALACPHCTLHKGSDIASLDPHDGRLTPFFHPRSQRWSDHFRLQDADILPLTAEGRVTARMLQLNHPDRIAERTLVLKAGIYPGILPEAMDDPNDTTDRIDPLTIGELITLAEAAAYAGLEKLSLYNYIKRGRLKAKRYGPIWLTTRAAIDEYLASRSLDNIPKKYRTDS